MTESIQPYAGTSGSVSVDTSQERSRVNDETGKTGRTQSFVLGMLESRGSQGITVTELRADPVFNGHHGDASSALTILHRSNKISRLKELRGRSHVYVLHSAVDGREELPFQKMRSYLPITNKQARSEAEEYIAQHSNFPFGYTELAKYLAAALKVE